MENPRVQTPAAKLKRALLAAMALVMAWAVLSAYLQSTENLAQLNSWTRHAAQITSTDTERLVPGGGGLDNLYAWSLIDSERWGWVQVEIAAAVAQTLRGARSPKDPPMLEPGMARAWLQRQPYAWHEPGEAVQIVQDPARPDRLFVLDQLAMWLLVAARLLLVALLGWCWRWLSLAPWGGDRTWTNGAWQETGAMAARAGSGAPPAPPVKEPVGNQVFGAVLGVAIGLPFALWMLTGLGAHPLEAGVLLVASLAVGGVSLRSVVKKHTRCVQFDEAGICDADFFGLRRVPWSAVKGLKVVNLNLKAQRRHDQSRKKRRSERPKDRLAWNVCGEQGVVLLQLARNMVPEGALAALRQRIDSKLGGGGADAFGFARQRPAPRAAKAPDAFTAEMEAFAEEAEANGGRVLDPNDPRDQQIIREHEEIVRKMDQVGADLEKGNKSAQRIVQGFIALVMLGLLWGSGYLGYQSLWFRFAAAEAQGRVVANTVGGQPALVVEYRSAAGQILRTRSDASEEYADVAIGTGVRVFHDPADPDRARLDLFQEMWLGTLLLGGLTLFVGLLAAAVAWGTMMPAVTKGLRG